MSFEQDEDDQYGQSYEDGTYQKNFTFDEDGTDDMLEQKPKIFIMGQKRCGKSSIEKVVFRKMSPNETLFLASTTTISKIDVTNSALVNFQIWDFPEVCDLNDLNQDDECEALFSGCGAIVFVIDAQDAFMDPLNKLNETVTKAYKVSPRIRFEVFIHKVDGLTEEGKIDAQHEIIQRANNDLSDSGFDQIHLSYHLTSIYDHSIFEAFSKVVQKLIPDLAILENSINDLILKSGVEKAFLFDVRSKIYIATDPSPVDMQIYELCCDMIDVVIDISGIYGIEENSESCAFDENSSSLIKLNNGTVLHLRQISHFLALVCILRDDNFDRGTIDYNILCFRKSFQQVFEDSIKSTVTSIIQNSIGSSA